MSSDFSGYGTWKSVRYIMCQTPGMTLWAALQLINIRTIENRHPTNEENKAAIRSFPYEANSSCRCRDCRYFQIFCKKT